MSTDNEFAGNDGNTHNAVASNGYEDGDEDGDKKMVLNIPVEVKIRAALIIQKAWTSFTNVRIFKYYRDLISFREKGDPSLLLKCINPSEAHLISDSACGAIVRFRLGGAVFPPMIYYKIFVARPIQDVCAFAPRDYTKEFKLDPKYRNLNGLKAPTTDRSQWYQRVENNGWRPVTKMWFADDAVAIETSKRVVGSFHPSSIVRQQDREKKRREKTLKWKQKMFKEGKLHEGGENIDNDNRTNVVNGYMNDDFDVQIRAIPNRQDQSSSTPDDDPLLDWASQLDFERYQQDWTSMASSYSLPLQNTTIRRAATTSSLK